jgi:hypothetical protein
MENLQFKIDSVFETLGINGFADKDKAAVNQTEYESIKASSRSFQEINSEMYFLWKLLCTREKSQISEYFPNSSSARSLINIVSNTQQEELRIVRHFSGNFDFNQPEVWEQRKDLTRRIRKVPHNEATRLNRTTLAALSFDFYIDIKTGKMFKAKDSLYQIVFCSYRKVAIPSASLVFNSVYFISPQGKTTLCLKPEELNSSRYAKVLEVMNTEFEDSFNWLTNLSMV